jgi:hypothetical protein
VTRYLAGLGCCSMPPDTCSLSPRGCKLFLILPQLTANGNGARRERVAKDLHCGPSSQRGRQIPVTQLAVTDGEAAYPDVPELGRTRRVEQARAAEALILDCVIQPLRSLNRRSLTELKRASIRILCSWRRGRAILTRIMRHAAERRQQPGSRTGATLIFYVFWTYASARWSRYAAIAPFSFASEARTVA